MPLDLHVQNSLRQLQLCVLTCHHAMFARADASYSRHRRPPDIQLRTERFQQRNSGWMQHFTRSMSYHSSPTLRKRGRLADRRRCAPVAWPWPTAGTQPRLTHSRHGPTYRLFGGAQTRSVTKMHVHILGTPLHTEDAADEEGPPVVRELAVQPAVPMVSGLELCPGAHPLERPDAQDIDQYGRL